MNVCTFIKPFVIVVKRVRSTASDFSWIAIPTSICLLLTAKAITLLNFVYHSFSVVQITFLGYLVKATFSNPDTYCVHVSFISNLLLSLPVVAAVGFQIRVES